MPKAKWKNFTDAELEQIVLESTSFVEVQKKMGYSGKSSAVTETLKQIFLEKNIDYSHFKGHAWNKKITKYENSLSDFNTHTWSTIKDKLFEEREYKCECCGITEWNGKPIALQLHHINGIHNDNRLSNLQLLCPNCHSQTENFGTKGRGTSIIRKAENLSKEDIDLIMDTVRKVGIVEARKQLTFRNSLINSVVKNHKDTIVMEDLKGNTKEFSTTVEAANYMFNELHLGTSVESIRTGISKCCNGKQKNIAGGYKFYRRSVEE